MHIVSALAAVAMTVGYAAPAAPSAAELRLDAQQVPKLINDNYAYLERLAGRRLTVPPKLESEASRLGTVRDLVRYCERVISLLADHHAITGTSLHDSWGIVPSYADLWITNAGTDYVIEQVRDGSPAAKAGVRAGDRLVNVDGVPIAKAVANFWADLGTTGGGDRDSYAARVLVAGRRDRPRSLTIAAPSGVRSLSLPNLYSVQQWGAPPVTVERAGREYRIRFNDSLGDQSTIGAFDRPWPQRRQKSAWS